MRTLVIFILTVGFSWVEVQPQTMQGVVYVDENQNGLLDSHEAGVSGVLVSNQRDVVQTDAQGRYTLPVMSRMIIFITKPSGYSVPLNKNQQPRFFYIHQPQGSPKNLKYAGLEPTGPLPKSVDFALYKSDNTENFEAIIVGDPQPRDSTEVGYFRDDIVSEMYGRKARFYIAHGDIAFDNLSIYKQYNQIVGKLGLPAYNVHGNHDMNLDVSHDSLAAETFKRHFGPADYSFNYGKVHFVVLDNVQYNGWDSDKNKNGGYTGYLNKRQLQWLKEDLKYTPQDYLVVINTHIPIKSPVSDGASINLTNRAELFKILEKRRHLLALSAHMHYIDHLEFAKQDGWLGDATFYNINVGAGCGAWWSGPKDARGIPESFCLDGSPNGFYIFSFSNNTFNYRYIPAHIPEYKQMRVTFPVGTVDIDSLTDKKILVNIYNADSAAKVYCSIDNGPQQLMQQATMRDPFIVEYLKDRSQFPGWINEAVKHKHMWTLPLPKKINTGTHTLHFNAKDSKNNIYRGFTIFNIL